METLTSLVAWQKFLQCVSPGRRIFFVPTMGALHQGHIELIKIAGAQARDAPPFGLVCVSIFVNQQQFSAVKDFVHYPRRNEEDLRVCETLQVDVVFLPSADDLNRGSAGQLCCRMPALTKNLCGPHRPQYFSGVISILLKFFFHIRPHVVFMGKKDYQQYRVVQSLVQELALDMKIVGVSTVREKDGLAISSRNENLSAEGRQAAAMISQGLHFGKKMLARKSKNCAKICEAICEAVKNRIESNSLNRVEYVQFVNAHDLSLLQNIRLLQNVRRLQERDGRSAVAMTKTPIALLATAVYVDDIRLIDNLECIGYGGDSVDR